MKLLLTVLITSLFLAATPQLQLSHIQCAGTDKVEVHFTLTHTDFSDPSSVVSYTLNSTERVAPWSAFTGGTNHYSEVLAQSVPTTYTVTSASVVYSGTVYEAHNLPFEVDNLNCHPTAISLMGFTAESNDLENVVYALLAVVLTLLAVMLVAQRK